MRKESSDGEGLLSDDAKLVHWCSFCCGNIWASCVDSSCVACRPIQSISLDRSNGVAGCCPALVRCDDVSWRGKVVEQPLDGDAVVVHHLVCVICRSVRIGALWGEMVGHDACDCRACAGVGGSGCDSFPRSAAAGVRWCPWRRQGQLRKTRVAGKRSWNQVDGRACLSDRSDLAF